MNNNKSAFPVFDGRGGADYECVDCGMTAKQYAAIHLKVPRSGDPEIDQMIRESRRAEFAGQALEGMMASNFECIWTREDVTERAFQFADALLAEWEKENGGKT